MHKSIYTDVVIIGGGLAGLSLAYYLKMKGIKYVILEKEARLGGCIYTKYKYGIPLDFGPNSFKYTFNSISFMNDIGVSEHLITPECRSTMQIYGDNGMRILGQSIIKVLFGSTIGYKMVPRLFLDIIGYNKIKLDRNTTIYEFCNSKFGKNFTNNVVQPIVNGIFSADIKELSLYYCFPSIYSLLVRCKSSVVRAIIKAYFNSSASKRLTVIPTLGMLEVVNKTASAIGLDSIYLDCCVNGIVNQGSHVAVNIVGHSNSRLAWNSVGNDVISVIGEIAVISSDYRSAVNIITSRMPEDLDDAKDALHSLKFNDIGVCKVCYQSDNIEYINHKLNAYGFLTSGYHSDILLGAYYSSSMFPRMSEKYKVFTLYFRVDNNKTKHELAREAINKFKSVLGIVGQPDLVESYIWKERMPVFNRKYGDFCDTVEEVLEKLAQGKVVINTGWYPHGNSISAIISKSSECANKIADTIKEKRA